MFRFTFLLEGTGHAAGLEFLLTYVVQSLLMALGAWVMLHVLRPTATKESWLWLLALLGPILLSAAAVLLPWGIAAESPASASVAGAAPEQRWAVHQALGYLDQRGSWLSLVLFAGLGLGLVRYLGSFVRLRRQLSERRPVQSKVLRRRFERSMQRFGRRDVRLSQAAIAVPMVIGGAEICIPRELNGFTHAELDAMFAHELAHLERRDGYWFPLVAAITSLGWFMPHHGWLARRFRRSAELACDDRCVEVVGDGSALAGALIRMASDVVASRRQRLAPSMASDSGVLLERVRLLTRAAGSGSSAGSPRAGSGRLRGGLAPLALVLLGLTLPSFGIARAQLSQPAIAAGAAASVSVEDDMAALAEEEAELSRRLRGMESYHTAESVDLANSPQILQLKQQLRHVHQRQAEAERRLASELSN